MKENMIPLGIANFLVLYLLFSKKREPVKEVTINEFMTFVAQRKIKMIDITKNAQTGTFFNVFGTMEDGTLLKLTIISSEQFLRALDQEQQTHGIPFEQYIPIKFSTETHEEESNFLPLLAMGALSVIILRLSKNYKNFRSLPNLKNKLNMGGKGDSGKESGSGGFKSGFKLNDLFDVSKSNVKEYGTEQKIKTKFKHVAGMEQAKKEVMEFVDFLKNPEKYHKLGAKIPRGALLVGPPGTGKTLLAKAVAGEAGVPFFAISGSDFVEMFVGVGAARVRDLFKKAKEKAPSIIFIDEIDAVGKKRGGKFTGGHDERDNTLNQLLVEMQGFGTENNVIVLAATNRADILDPALLRPGRFDRQIEVSLPDRKEREAILKIYLKKVKLDTTKTIEEYALRLSTLTPGFSGADISNLVNEAAIISARNNWETVTAEAFERAAERVIAGLETKRVLSDKEKKIVAFHEAGHAIVGWFLEHTSPIVKVTIIPRSKGSLGFTQYVPDDISLHSKEQLYEMMCVCLGGRMAEEYFFNSITTGASDDLQKVTNIATNLVTRFGMSSLGLAAYNISEESFAKPYSSDTESAIDQEIKKIIDECAERTRNIIKERSNEIKALADALLQKETIDLLDIITILGERPYPMPESMKDYVREIEERRKLEAEKAAKKQKEEEEAKLKNPEASTDAAENENKTEKNDQKEDQENSEEEEEETKKKQHI